MLLRRRAAEEEDETTVVCRRVDGFRAAESWPSLVLRMGCILMVVWWWGVCIGLEGQWCTQMCGCIE